MSGIVTAENPGGTEAVVTRFESGAVRGTDTQGERYDLLPWATLGWMDDRVTTVGISEAFAKDTVELLRDFRGEVGLVFDLGLDVGPDGLPAYERLRDTAHNLLGPTWKLMLASHFTRGGDRVFLGNLPPRAIRAYAEAMAEGVTKYTPWNWLKGFPVHDMINHALKHVNNYLDGDTSEDHLGHAVWNMAGAIHFCLLGRSDLFKGFRLREKAVADKPFQFPGSMSVTVSPETVAKYVETMEQLRGIAIKRDPPTWVEQNCVLPADPWSEPLPDIKADLLEIKKRLGRDRVGDGKSDPAGPQDHSFMLAGHKVENDCIYFDGPRKLVSSFWFETRGVNPEDVGYLHDIRTDGWYEPPRVPGEPVSDARPYGGRSFLRVTDAKVPVAIKSQDGETIGVRQAFTVEVNKAPSGPREPTSEQNLLTHPWTPEEVSRGTYGGISLGLIDTLEDGRRLIGAHKITDRLAPRGWCLSTELGAWVECSPFSLRGGNVATCGADIAGIPTRLFQSDPETGAVFLDHKTVEFHKLRVPPGFRRVAATGQRLRYEVPIEMWGSVGKKIGDLKVEVKP